jgi:DNA-binding MurR/RpiR family transcriptional regulator
MDIILRLTAEKDGLPKAERKIADYIIENAEQIELLSSEQLAKITGTSRGAIHRLLKRMEIDGYAQLKFQIEQALKTRKYFGDTSLKETDTNSEVFSKLRSRMVFALEATEQRFNPDIIDDCVEEIINAEVLFVFGAGSSDFVAHDLYSRFSYTDKEVYFEQDYLNLASYLSNKGTDRNALLILISDSGEVGIINTLAKLAREIGIRTIGITSNNKSKFHRSVDHSIVIKSVDYGFALRTSPTDSLITMLMVSSSLFYCYAIKHFDEIKNKIENSNSLKAKFNLPSYLK